MTTGLLAYGAYLPRLRLSRKAAAAANAWFNPALGALGRGERAMAKRDEAAVTGLSPEGGAIRDVMDGVFDSGGALPRQIDGGLKCFGHPIGASGLCMLYELYLQILGRAGERQRQQEPVLGLTHNLGGFPHMNVRSISVIGKL